RAAGLPPLPAVRDGSAKRMRSPPTAAHPLPRNRPLQRGEVGVLRLGDDPQPLSAIRRVQQGLDPTPVRRRAGVSIELELQRDGAVEPNRAAPAAFFALPAERETLAEAEFGKDNDLHVGEGVILNVD